MEHLDLAGVITTTTNWNTSAFEQQDAIYLSNSRQMLEPIMEETSEDEEFAQNSWNQYENTFGLWSSTESDTGSVIRIEINNDPDSISEREFVCPAKRSRRSDEICTDDITTQISDSVADTVLLRTYECSANCSDEANNSLERFISSDVYSRDSWGSTNQQRSSAGSRRFDDFYLDSDSLSYNSLSRSSSLVQFESLERQLLLQEQHSSMTSLGNSSPSLLSFEGSSTITTQEDGGSKSGANSGCSSGNNSRRGSQNSLPRRFESADGRLHQTYFDLDKLNLDDTKCVRSFNPTKSNTIEATVREIKSDSESLSTSSSGSSILTVSRPSFADELSDTVEGLLDSKNIRATSFHRVGMNSVENLSEDSGYCEPSTLKRTKSRGYRKCFENFSEEEEERQRHECNGSELHEPNANSKSFNGATQKIIPAELHSINFNKTHYKQERNILCRPKINDTKIKLESTDDETSFRAQTTPHPAKAETPLASCRCKNDDKNSITMRENFEHNRSFTHSPSPLSVSSDASGSSNCTTKSSSASILTCASATSFVWLPTTQPAIQTGRTLGTFSSTLRNSLPDIRDVFGFDANLLKKDNSFRNYGNGLDRSKILAPEEYNILASARVANEHSRNAVECETSSIVKKVCIGVEGENINDGDILGSDGILSNTIFSRSLSMPNELNELGRKKRSSLINYDQKFFQETDKSDIACSSNDEDDFCDESSLKLHRSSSWSELTERNLQRKINRTNTYPKASKLLGYMNASYQNLTLLDYTGRIPVKNQSNYKRSSVNMDSARASNADYESLVCKGNFLLDELSEIYDRNASILNDKPIVENNSANDSLLQKFHKPEEVLGKQNYTPKAPPRQHKPSSSNYSDVDCIDGNEAPHIHFTISKAPPPRGNTHRGDIAKSSTNKPNSTLKPSAITFDQDPTNLKTSYAQSLEKCNFDPKEVSTLDKTKPVAALKRRFHSQASAAAAAQKRNLVSSTPNLNAFDPRANETEGDMYISSAHNSMHQLPQSAAQKPLGILLQAGSRNSIGKEVSFCPVVSKYSWQEQSSEECNESTNIQRANDQSSGAMASQGENEEGEEEEEETDDELLDNTDETVIFNTKENEMIAARYNKEQHCEHENSLANENEIFTRARETQSTVRKSMHSDNKQQEGNTTIHEMEAKANTPITKLVSDEINSIQQQQRQKNISLLSSAAVEAATDNEVSSKAAIVSTTVSRPLINNSDGNSIDAAQLRYRKARPLSIQLPILSEPPTNRAHLILYASHQMLDNLQGRELKEQEPSNRNANGEEVYLKSKSSSNFSIVSHQNNNSKMSNCATNIDTNDGGIKTKQINNNNDLVKSKFKADEKHPNSKGFLSRFTHGFRFSLRRNKKKQLQQQKEQEQLQQQQQQQQQQQNYIINDSVNSNITSNKNRNSESNFIHIPLKGPLPNQLHEDHNMPSTSTSPADFTSANITPNRSINSSTQASNNHSATGNIHTNSTDTLKIGGKRTENKTHQASGTLKVTGKPPIPKYPQRYGELHSASLHAHQHHSNHEPMTMTTKQIVSDFLDAERLLYDDFKNQLTLGSPTNGCVASSGDGSVQSKQPNFESLGRNIESKTQEMLLTGAGIVSSGNEAATSIISAPSAHFNNDKVTNKIGLIETNLDTHETIIMGKTRSLMDIGPLQPNSIRSYSKRLNMHSTACGANPTNDVDDDDIYIEEDAAMEMDNVIVKPSQTGGQIASVRRPHKSMEFLLDKENQKDVLPPENELQKSHDHNPATLSEHQLRIQASLQRLNIPDWFRQYNQATARSPDAGTSGYKPGNFTRKRATESGRWAGLNSKTTSLSSLGSHRSDRSPLLLSPSAHSHHGGQTTLVAHHPIAVPYCSGGGAGTFSRWSTSHLNSSQTSPSVSQRSSFTRGGPINSSFISVASGTSSALRNSFRQPYLGWRSQEKLSQRTPHERLASSLLSQQLRTSQAQPNSSGNSGVRVKLQPVTPEIQTSIKEVTSAIVHYVNDQTNPQHSRSGSPTSRKCWLESSFVGIRPLDSPQTPIIEGSTFSAATNYNNNSGIHSNLNNATIIYPHVPVQMQTFTTITTATTSAATTTNADILRMNGRLGTVGSGGGGGGAPQRSLSTASLEDVLASLLGLPSNMSCMGASTSGTYDRPTTGATASGASIECHYMPNKPIEQHQLQVEQQRLRRRSEGDTPSPQDKQQQQHQQQQQKLHISQATQQNVKANETTTIVAESTASIARRVSLGDSSESNNKTISELQIKCRNTKCDKTATQTEAKKYYKSCHNCTHLYCSRECRRAHWEKHRKACLHSRASNLCRQVLATCKDDYDSQRHLSLLARKGFLSQGRGVVRVLFRSAEAAEGFIKHGFQCMGEASYVRWPDLMPAEMGLELYSELLKLSTEYKADSKMLIYVAICVVSEAPGMGQAPVRWERQLVSRCAKLKLCKTVLAELEQQQALQQQSVAVVAIPEPATEILILTFNPCLRSSAAQRELIFTNIIDILSRRGVLLRKHYPEIYQRLQTYSEGQTDKFNPVTLHPRDSQTGHGFVCIIMPVHSDSEIIKLPSAADGGNRVSTIDVGSPAALAQFDDDDLLTRSTS